ncbi:nuclear transport factor 2 family protein [Parapedobacter pyrenivorans]|uniref:nuclear transport factor 2 family protein n=1 Tax=Parapedobacter pyrenivorans TaxID=1305674 RepID=UPI003340D3E3
MTNTTSIVHTYLQHLAQRNLEEIVALFGPEIDWYIPGDETRAPWLGKRSSRAEIIAFFKLLWANTNPISADVHHIFIDGNRAAVTGEFVTEMRSTGKQVESLFTIEMTIENGYIVRYRLLEDSHAVSEALA